MPSSTSKADGTAATAGLLLLSRTRAPPPGVWLSSVALASDGLPPTIGDAKVSDERLTARFVSDAELLERSGSDASALIAGRGHFARPAARPTPTSAPSQIICSVIARLLTRIPRATGRPRMVIDG